MTIVDKVINLLQLDKTLTLNEIYNKLPEHTHASIRGNINRYLSSDGEKQFQRVERGIYSVIEIISVSKIDEQTSSVNYMASYYCGDKQINFIHKDFITSSSNIAEGIYARMDDFSSFESLENHISSVRGMLIRDNAISVLKRLKDESFSLILTDPPYKVISGGSGGKNAPKGMLSKNDGKIFKHNDIKFSDYMSDLYRVLKPDSHAYFFTNLLNLQELMEEVQRVGFKIHNLLVWKKNTTNPSRWYMKNCEYVLFCRKGKAKSINESGSQTVHEFKNIIGNKIHETEKPIDLLRMYIRNSTNSNDYVLDPFGGSGSTLISALLENRRCLTIELDDLYIPRIQDRVRDFLRTGRDFRETVNAAS